MSIMTTAHKHQQRWTTDERLDLLDLEDDEMHGSVIAVGGGAWIWRCQGCGRHGHEGGPDPAHAWSAFLEHERETHWVHPS